MILSAILNLAEETALVLAVALHAADGAEEADVEEMTSPRMACVAAREARLLKGHEARKAVHSIWQRRIEASARAVVMGLEILEGRSRLRTIAANANLD